MKYKIFFIFILLLCIFQNSVFCMSPRFRDEFYIENKTREKIVVVLETIGILGAYLRHNYSGENGGDILLSIRTNDPRKSFRTIRRGQRYEIGFSQYNQEGFNTKTPEEKFSAFFQFILIFNDDGDLLYRIDDFSKWKIEDRTKSGPSMYVLVIE